jgi:hypothetical protein
MRKNAKPLAILIDDPEWFELPEIEALEKQGHQLVESSLDFWDVSIGPRHWRIDPAWGHLDKQLAMMIEGVRNVKYPKTEEAV